MKYEKLFSSIKIGSLTLKNRFVMAPMSVHMTEDGSVTPQEIAYTERRAAGGAAMLIIGSVCIHPSGDFGGQLYIEKDERIEGLKALTKAVHKHDCYIAAQIHHAGRETNRKTTGSQPVAPSFFEPEEYEGLRAEYDPPHVLTREEVKMYVEYYAQAVRRAKEAGFDACELHCAHGYLIGEFMSPLTNKRTDEYGGCFIARMRFVTEIIKRCRELVGNDYPIMARIVGDELRPGGIDMALSVKIAKYLESLNVAALSVSADLYPFVRTVPNMYHKRGVNLYLVENIRSEVHIPVIAAGQLNRPDIQLAAIEHGKADMIALGRALIADPDYPNKLKDGNEDAICYCIACNKGCHDRSARERYVKCTLNVQAGREMQSDFCLQKIKLPMKVVIVGGGPAGLEAATIAAKRGCEVTLFEKADSLGGRLKLAAVPPGKQGYLEACNYLIKNMKKDTHIKYYLNTEATLENIKIEKPDMVILATGSIPVVPPIDGIETAAYVFADDVLSGKCEVGNKIAIIGGGAVGAELAHLLIEQKKREITILEMKDEIAGDMPQDSRICLMRELKGASTIKIMTHTKVTKIENKKIYWECGLETGHIDALDTIILASGAKANRELQLDLVQAGYVTKVIGDANKPKDLVQAIYDGFTAANLL